MIHTLSICSTCYKKIPATIIARDGAAWIIKDCPVHGIHEGMIDPDFSHIMRFYETGSEWKNKCVLVPVTDKCNMECSWCFTRGVTTKENCASYYSKNMLDLHMNGYTILLSGGEPTVRQDFFQLCWNLHQQGWPVVTMSNMLKFSDPAFMQEAANVGLVQNGVLHADFSMQHPKNYSGEVAAKKYQALTNLEKFGLKANCIQFSISDLDELVFIRQFYNDTKHLYNNIRIRTLFGFWKDTSKKIYLSQLFDAFSITFGDLTPTISRQPERSNIYSIFMNDGTCGISLGCSPTVENVDLMSARRPTYGVALDDKYYSFPVAQIISEGIQKGWYNGFKLAIQEA